MLHLQLLKFYINTKMLKFLNYLKPHNKKLNKPKDCNKYRFKIHIINRIKENDN